jgi:hypothetical protein
LRRRRTALIAILSLGAHVALLAAWIGTRADLRFVEPATLQVELIRPTPLTPPQRAPPRRVAASAPEAAPAMPPATRPPAPPSPVLSSPKSLDVGQLTDQELLARSGPRPDIARLNAEQARQPLFSRPLGRNPEDGWMGGCKPSWENSTRAAPPCRSDSPEERSATWKAANDRKTAPFEAEGAYKRAMKTYHEAPGGAGYPGVRCALLHKC